MTNLVSAENNSATNVVDSISVTESIKTQKRKPNRKPIPLLWRVLGKAKKKFDAQLSHTNETKLECVDIFVASDINDAPKFWGDFMEQVDKLMDSRKYTKECERLGYIPENIAEHIVFLGSATVNKVLKNGVQNTLNNHLKLYIDKFSPDVAGIFRETDSTTVELSPIVN